MALGLALTLRWRSPAWPTFISEGLHRYLTTVLFVFLVIHIVTIWLDPFTKFSLADVLIPFVSSYKPVWMALGILSAELAFALGLSIYIRERIGYRAWRVAHYATNVIFPLAYVHALGTGTDTHAWWGVAFYLATGIPVASLSVARAIGGDVPAPAATPSPVPSSRFLRDSTPCRARLSPGSAMVIQSRCTNQRPIPETKSKEIKT